MLSVDPTHCPFNRLLYFKHETTIPSANEHDAETSFCPKPINERMSDAKCAGTTFCNLFGNGVIDDIDRKPGRFQHRGHRSGQMTSGRGARHFVVLSCDVFTAAAISDSSWIDREAATIPGSQSPLRALR